jgi:multidrug transporter EmrE-like cation transporter
MANARRGHPPRSDRDDLNEALSKVYPRLPSVLIFVFYACLFVALTLVLERLALSVVYAIWAGVGTVRTTLIGLWKVYVAEAFCM